MADVVQSDLGDNKKKSRLRTMLIVGGILVIAGGAGVGLRLLQNKTDSDKGKDGQQVVGQPLPGNAEEIQNLRVSGDEAEASRMIEEDLKDSSTSDEERYILYIQKGNIAYDKQDYNAAIAAYMDAYDVKVTFEVTRLIADSYEQAGNKPKALEYYKKALPLVPPSPVQDADKGVIEKKIKDLEG